MSRTFFAVFLGVVIQSLTTLSSTASANGTCDPPPSGLVGWWKGENNANDSIGANNGTLSASGASYAAGMVGQAFRFDGTNGFVQVPDSPALKPANVSVEAWVWLDPNLPSTNGGEQIVFKKNTWSAWFEGYSLSKQTIANSDGTSSDYFQFVVSRDGDQVVINSQTIAQRGVWYHVAATYDGNQSILYVNGVAEASATPGFALDYDTTPLFIGTTGTWAPYLNMFGGIIDEVSIYNRALSAGEIAAIYNAGSAGKCVPAPPPPPSTCDQPPSGLVSWWKGEDNANDSIGANNGTLSASGTSYSAGMVGQAFRFDGTNGFVQAPDSPTLKPANVSVEAWVWLDPNLPSTNGGEQIVFKKNTWSAWFEGYSLLKGTIANGDGTSSDHFQFVVSRYGDQVVINSQTIAQRGVWYHVAATYDGNQSTLYVNGVAEASATAGFALDYDTTPLFIGTTGTWAPYLNMFGGIIDEVSIYNRALSAAEVAAIYNAGSAGKCVPPPPSPPSACDPPPSGLVSWWKGEDNANDSIGTNNGTLSASGASYVAGMVGQAFRFDGTNGFVQAPDSPTLKPANVSVEAWVWLDPNLQSTNGGEQIVFKKNTWSAWFEGYSLLKGTIANDDGTSSDHFQFVVSRDGDQVVINSETIAQRGVWYHVAATYDGNQSTLYVNGVAEASATAGFALDYDTTPLFIGTTGTWAPYLNMFGGIIDEVSIYNGALSAGEVAAIYNAGSAGKCVPPPPSGCDPPPSGLVSWWKGEDNANDSIGTNNGALSASGASYAPGMVGQAFRFDGTNGFVQAPDSPTLKPANVSVEAWVWLDPNLPSANGGEQIVFKKNTWSAWFEGYSLSKQTIANSDGTSSDYFQFVVSRDGDQVVINSQTIAQRGVWYHVAATYDGNQSTLYVNGVAEASAMAGFALDYDTTPLFIGTTGTWAPYLNMFGGIIDEVSIYNRALSAAEVAAIYNAGSAGKCAARIQCLSDCIATTINTPVSFAGAKLTLNDIDLNGCALTVTGVNPLSVNGGTNTLTSGIVTYNPPPNFAGLDSFLYTVSDGQGASASGTVTVKVGPTQGPSQNLLFGPQVVGGNVVFKFSGFSGLTYTIQSATNLNGPWCKLTNFTAPMTNQGLGEGVFQFQAPAATGMQFYRTVYPPY